MQNINKILLKDEKVLWYRIENVNLVYFIRGIIIFVLCSFLIVPILDIYLFYNIEEFEELTLPTVFLIIDGVLIWLAIYNYRKRKKRLELTYKELKNYEEFVVLTNKRYIRRNYYLNYKIDLSRYIFENVLEQIGDVIFVNLEKIKTVIIEYQVKEINFLFEDDQILTPFYIKFLKMDSDELEKVIKIVVRILNLERVEKYPRYEKYIRK